MRLSNVAACAYIVVVSLMSVSLTRAASDCSISGTLADWGESSTSDIDLSVRRKLPISDQDAWHGE
jgi:hypothetical protein